MHYPVWRQSWTGILPPYMLDMLGPPKRWAEEVYPKSLNPRGWQMWIAEYGDQTLGMTIFGPDSATPDHLQVDALYTAPEHQRHGIGRLLLNEALRANPSGDVILWCAEQNGKARRFYENQNFRVDGRTFTWTPGPGVSVPHVGYRFFRSAPQGLL